MRLKRLEIRGFKSFAEKTVIEIKDGITAIVGPNGSGKSNISDAIRWVLGEQSIKTLRGTKMEDVIFAGTDKRRALGYSEVTITFDNKSGEIPIDFAEVAITRRVFRSGESEYYINKSSCRLKDIRELFMDTGVGKDGYSIIGQGRIDEILSNRPEDRRSIFEEAAGVVKYKSKKIEAEKRLGKTETNLIRIKDLVYELSNQQEILKSQSNKATSFTKLFNRLKELEINLFIRDIKRIHIQTREINKNKLILEEELTLNIAERQTIEDRLNILKDSTKELDTIIEEYRHINSTNLSKIDKYKQELAIIQEKKKFHEKDIERLEVEKSELNTKLKNTSEIIYQLKKEKTKLLDEYGSLLDEYNNRTSDMDNKFSKLIHMEKEIENKKDNIITIYNNISDKRSELNSIGSFNENINKHINQLKKDFNEMTDEKEIYMEKYRKSVLDEKNINIEYNQLLNKLKDLKEMEENNNKTIDLISKEINANNTEIQSKTSNLDLFINMEKDYEGYYKGVKSILKATKSDFKLREGFVGVVAELINVDERFERAIDISLGSNAQNIVTETEEYAKSIIEYLKSKKLGRVTCLPLNVIDGKEININQQDKKEFKILGLANELISFDKRYDNLFKFLLGRTIIIENMDYGIKLANKYKHSLRIITLDGEALNPGGSITGGSHGGNSIGIITRKNKINTLKLDISDLKSIQKTLESKKIEIIKESNILKNNIIHVEDLLKNSEHSMINIKNKKDNFNNEAIRLEDSIVGSKKEINSLELELMGFQKKKDELINILGELEASSLEEKQRIKELTDLFNEEKTVKDEEYKQITEMKISLNSIENNIENLEERIKENNILIEQTNKQLEDRKNNIIQNKNNIADTDKTKEGLDEIIKELEILNLENKDELTSLLVKRENTMNEYYAQQEKLQELNNNILKTEKFINTEEIKLARFSVQEENYIKKLNDDYELTFDEALEFEGEVKNVQETLVEVRRLKGEIKELGTVNLSSIEEYKNLKTRLDFILNQQQDLIEAKESLKEVIRDMENKMTKQFLISFEEINENFKEIFKILFDGGEAELYLETDDVLNSGIEIKAQPPGKKLQNLSLLSGGEKSLTAVALLFSILKMKPSPFCILDEIDAALDEANINRYTNYLKSFHYDTQFVLITHRKTTMEIADVLYGVAMEEEGISKLISVKLKDYLDEVAS